MTRIGKVIDTVNWFRKAIPKPDSTNLHTQIGVHFEEVAEMLATMSSSSDLTSFRLRQAQKSLEALALHLKGRKTGIEIEDRIELLDALCDQMVTAIGIAHMADMDIVGGFEEINRSNFSKFDDNENPVLDKNKKIIKSHRYCKPNLQPFV